MQITFENYDQLQEQLEALPNTDTGWLPSQADLETYVIPDPEKHLEFLLWLTFTVQPKSEEIQARRKVIQKILYKKIMFLD